MLDALFKRNFDSYYGHDLEVPNQDFRERTLGAPEVNPVHFPGEPLDTRSSQQAPGQQGLRDDPFNQSAPMVKARQAYRARRSYATVRTHIDAALAQAKTSRQALVVAQFAYEHFFRYEVHVGALQALFGGRPGHYEKVGYHGLSEGAARAVELAGSPSDVRDIVDFLASLRDRGFTGSVSVVKSNGTYAALKKSLDYFSDSRSIAKFVAGLPLQEGRVDDGAFDLAAKAVIIAKDTVDFSYAAEAIATVAKKSNVERLEWGLEQKRLNPGVKLEINRWFAKVV